MNGKSCYVLRGIPGSGKSTWAGENLPEALVVSADRFNIDPITGKYTFNRDSHKSCLKLFMEYIEDDEKYIVVDNTNIRLIEAAPYMALAAAHDYSCTLVTLICPPEICAARNIHDVPKEKVFSMYHMMMDETSKIPSWWKHQIINNV